MIICYLICAFLLYFYRITAAVQINFIKVPVAVKNNSKSPIILDCNYSVRPDDQELVVKWFLNDEVVYQWIPPQKPQSLGPLQNKLDLSYKATDDPKTVYRAMKIVNPTVDMAGEYKCFVSTIADEDSSYKKMIVFEPEERLVLFKGSFKNKYVNFTCFADNVFPQPKIAIYEGKRDDYYKKNPLESLEWNVRKHQTGKYSVFMISTAHVSRLIPGSLIHCELRIPGTGYLTRKSLLYYPSDMDVHWNGSSKTIYSALFLQMFIAIKLL